MQKHANIVDLVKSFPTSIYLQTLASIQPRTSLVKFARSPRTDPPGAGGHDPRDGRVDRRHRHRGQKQALRRQGSANKHTAVVPLCFLNRDSETT